MWLAELIQILLSFKILISSGKFIRTHLTESVRLSGLPDMYDKSQWPTELEAFAGAKAYTSSQLEELFLDMCTLQESFDG